MSDTGNPVSETKGARVTDRRPVEALALADVAPNEVASTGPIFEDVDPATLLVDERYQRELSPKGRALIAKIVAGWDWRRFKPPVAVMVDDGLELIDGQHTAIAAATHPGVATIPVMIVEAAEVQQRAAAFIGHNRDRIAVSAMDLHHAAVAAGDEDALTVQQICDRAGVTIRRQPPYRGAYAPRDTVALAAIGALVSKRGAMRARQIVEALANAELAPISAAAIKAADFILHDGEMSSEIDLQGLTAAIVAAAPTVEHETKITATTLNVPAWRAMAIVWFKARPKRRKPAAAEEGA
ncbi:hypothetical protein ACFQ4O_02055 [Methylopila musalis]|uniref:ParB-like nuclease domain protein n=1 Tax=Methylopila musalis TaxID=1134781 RepID=A0ABW3Z4K7_9HYPH